MANKKIELDEATFDKINYTYDALHKKYGDDLGVVSFPPPINVVRAGDLQNLKFNAVAPIPQELKDDIAVIKAYYSEIKEGIAELKEKPEKEPEPAPVPDPKEPEAKEKVSIGKKLSQWINSKVAVYINMALLLASTAFMIIAGLYALRWSDDAWARRAYDVGERIGMERPGDFYHETRQRFNTEQRRTAKAAVLDMEEHDGKIDGKHEDDTQVAGEEDNTDTNLKKESTPWIISILKKLDELDQFFGIRSRQ